MATIAERRLALVRAIEQADNLAQSLSCEAVGGAIAQRVHALLMPAYGQACLLYTGYAEAVEDNHT